MFSCGAEVPTAGATIVLSKEAKPWSAMLRQWLSSSTAALHEQQQQQHDHDRSM